MNTKRLRRWLDSGFVLRTPWNDATNSVCYVGGGVGIVLGALILAGAWAANLLALSRHHVFIGANYQFVAIDTYGQLIALVFITAFCAYLLLKKRR